MNEWEILCLELENEGDLYRLFTNFENDLTSRYSNCNPYWPRIFVPIRDSMKSFMNEHEECDHNNLIRAMCDHLANSWWRAGNVSKLPDNWLLCRQKAEEYFKSTYGDDETETKEEIEMDSETTKEIGVITEITYIDGKDVESMSDSELFGKIQTIENNIKDMEAIENKPKRLVLRIKEAQDSIKKLIKLIDSLDKK